MLRGIVASLGAAVNAVGRAINSALGAVSSAVLAATTALAPKAPPQPPDPGFGGDPIAGVCPGGKDWRGPFPAAIDADEYRSDIPVPTSIHQFVDGWWVHIDYDTLLESDDEHA